MRLSVGVLSRLVHAAQRSGRPPHQQRERRAGGQHVAERAGRLSAQRSGVLPLLQVPHGPGELRLLLTDRRLESLQAAVLHPGSLTSSAGQVQRHPASVPRIHPVTL